MPFRRSARVQIRVPVTISGVQSDGTRFSEETQAITVSKFGAKLKCMHAVQVGAQITVKPRRSGTALFRVVWVGREGTPRAGDIGVEYLEVSNLLGITFPE